MTYKIAWLVPDRVIDVMLPEECTDSAIAQFDADLMIMLDAASQPVHVLVDVRSMKVYPSAQASMKMSYYKHPKLKRIFVIGLTSNPIIRFLGSLVARGAGIQLRDFVSREEALAYLAAVEKI
jgi:hypothetical protein